ncbi:Histone acetyltransferase HPA2 [Lysobacter capsici AZ78]|uniref:Histone acetyltransferase HPA2 n=2 Tax=Lysobacter capsici TaxID=435897 RepID=A0A125TZQ0_9GAMM|nr:Histone acetyltransferase HPA2 [Lysobacter capsici AZ78]
MPAAAVVSRPRRDAWGQPRLARAWATAEDEAPQPIGAAGPSPAAPDPPALTQDADMKKPMPEIRSYAGAEITPYLEAIAALRIAVFRDWPYLYDGDAAYEAKYLQTYRDSWRSIAVLAFDGPRVVGASTGVPMSDEIPEFRAAFDDHLLDVDHVFYCGESVLLPEYRGRGVGHRFFDMREAHARALGGFNWTTFCAVEREPGDTRQPPFHRGNEVFWKKRGYTHRPELRANLPWNEVGRGEREHTLSFWLRPLGRA